MSEPQPVYYADIIPTRSELKLIARLRQLRGMAIVDSDSMTLWAARGPEYCNGKHAPTLEDEIIAAKQG